MIFLKTFSVKKIFSNFYSNPFQVNKFPNEVVLLCLGALTNIALALYIDPSIAKKVKRAVYMGMGHQLKESQTDLFPFMERGKDFKPGNGKYEEPWCNLNILDIE